MGAGEGCASSCAKHEKLKQKLILGISVRKSFWGGGGAHIVGFYADKPLLGLYSHNDGVQRKLELQKLIEVHRTILDTF
jgi:hypothetical protein